ncbi:RNA polymerase sigma factor SigZ [bacterium M21]|nr:RNA polymerase sigma factor SigZ [bacterium M21]
MNNIEMVWQAYHSRLLSFIQSRVSDPTIAEDILQDVFIRINKRLDTLKEDSKLRSWIYQITRNAIIDYYRSHRESVEVPESLSMPEEDMTDRIRAELGHCMRPMIDELPTIYREAILLSEIEGVTQKEVADKQGISLSGAKSRVQRGRGLLKEMLQACCHLDTDHRGKIVDYKAKGGDSCKHCSDC